MIEKKVTSATYKIEKIDCNDPKIDRYIYKLIEGKCKLKSLIINGSKGNLVSITTKPASKKPRRMAEEAIFVQLSQTYCYFRIRQIDESASSLYLLYKKSNHAVVVYDFGSRTDIGEVKNEFFKAIKANEPLM